MTDKYRFDEEFRTKLIEGFKTVPFAMLLGAEMIDIKEGEATLSLDMRPELKQPYGVLHGGATASLIDTATAFAVFTAIGPEEKATTSTLTVHYLRPHTEGKVTCIAKVIKSGRKILTVSAEVTNEDGNLVATAISSYSKI